MKAVLTLSLVILALNIMNFILSTMHQSYCRGQMNNQVLINFIQKTFPGDVSVNSQWSGDCEKKQYQSKVEIDYQLGRRTYESKR